MNDLIEEARTVLRKEIGRGDAVLLGQVTRQIGDRYQARLTAALWAMMREEIDAAWDALPAQVRSRSVADEQRINASVGKIVYGESHRVKEREERDHLYRMLGNRAADSAS